ncbi:hypothetical protein [Peribacillus simplex]|uniref:Uncharacterized protein n=1 Tax=Peribacillus simplex TaxID=1478 RepID=A0AAW7I995_9BACI|nr:hypothetical protein [Peribacillus simplex]MDM5451034.1 hypothetical protein [Peribacillus simplex]
MKKCTLCNYDNSETDETLVGWLNRNKIIEIDLCESHENELNAFCKED